MYRDVIKEALDKENSYSGLGSDYAGTRQQRFLTLEDAEKMKKEQAEKQNVPMDLIK